MNPSRSIARPFNECMPCLLMIRLVMLTLVAIITSTMMVLTGPPSRDPNSSGLGIPMTFASAERPSAAKPESAPVCGSARSGSDALGSVDPNLRGEAGSYDSLVSLPRPCFEAPAAGGPRRSGGFDRRLPILLTPRAIEGLSD